MGAVSGVTTATSTTTTRTAALQIVLMRSLRPRQGSATARRAARRGDRRDKINDDHPKFERDTAGGVTTTATTTMTTAIEGQAVVVKHGEAVTPPSRQVSTA